MTRKRPYKLPEPLLCDVDKEITMELVTKYISQHEERFPRYEYFENLYKGFHDIFRLPEKESWKPDNRLAVNFPKYITDVFIGYAYGIAIKREFPEVAAEAFAEFDDINSMDEHDFELAKKVCIYGHAIEYFYQDEEAKTRVSDLSPKEAFIVYENTLRKAGYFSVRYGYKDDKTTRYGEIHTREEIISFVGDEITERKPNPYGKLPVVEYVMNNERMGIYEGVAGLVESFNKGVGEKANDVEAFAEAYLAVLGAEVDDKGVHRIRDSRLINIYGTDNAKDVLVQFLSKPTADETQENHLDRLERLIHKISMVLDMNSEDFGGATGAALDRRLQPMANLAKTFDEKLKKSMSKRYKLFCTLSTNCPNKDAWKEIKYTPTRNVPRNLIEEAQTAQALEGTVSKETQLSVLSIVDSPKEEIERIDKENKKAEQTLVDRMTFGVAGNAAENNAEGVTNDKS